MCVLTERRRRIRCSDSIRFGIRAIPTGRIGANPVMYLIEIGSKWDFYSNERNDAKTTSNLFNVLGSIHMYTGQFVESRSMLLSSAVLHYSERITDIYVDNTVAGLRQPYLLQQACSKIQQIVR